MSKTTHNLTGNQCECGHVLGKPVQGHTPGPWTVDKGRVIAPHQPPIKFGDKKEYEHPFIVCQPGMYSNAGELDSDSQTANAHLIAASPDLLAACQWALAFIDDGEGGEVEARTLRAAIAKAEGRSV